MGADLRKVFAVGVVASVLGLQLWAIVPPMRGGREWYWPFIDYPMYSRAWSASDSVVVRELRLVPCDPSRPVIVATGSDVGLTDLRLADLIGVATAARRANSSDRAYRESVEAMLARRIATGLPDAYCEAQIWAKSVRNGSEVRTALRGPWRQVHSWKLTNRPVHAGERHGPREGA